MKPDHREQVESAEVCEFCGVPITEQGQRCLALDDGRCRQ